MRIALAGPARLDELQPLVDDPFPAGAEPISGGSPVSALATALVRGGHEVSVATLAHGVHAPLTRRGPGVEVHVGPYRPQHRARDAFSAERRAVRAALERSRPEVIHAHWTYEFALAALSATAPVVVTVRDWAPTIVRHHPHPYRVVRLGMAAAVLRRAPVLTATSPYLQARVARWARGEVHLVPNAIADEDFLDPLPPARDPASPVVVAINNGWGARKNVATLLRAWPRLRSRHPRARLRLIGSGYEQGGPAATYAAEHDAADGVEFVGALPYRQAMAALAEADLFVHPSREESFGLVLVEAMARGVPVVGGRASGAVPWVCDGGRAGTLVDVEDPVDIADAAAAILDDPAAQDDRRRHAHRRARERFSLGAVTDAYLELYARQSREGQR